MLMEDGSAIIRDIEFIGHQTLPYRLKNKVSGEGYAYEGS